jgi:hypothetical protein
MPMCQLKIDNVEWRIVKGIILLKTIDLIPIDVYEIIFPVFYSPFAISLVRILYHEFYEKGL